MMPLTVDRPPFRFRVNASTSGKASALLVCSDVEPTEMMDRSLAGSTMDAILLW